MSNNDSNQSFIDELLANSEKKYSKPTPSAVSATANNIEEIFNNEFSPLISINAVICILLYLIYQNNVSNEYMGIISLFLGIILFVFGRKTNSNLKDIYLNGSYPLVYIAIYSIGFSDSVSTFIGVTYILLLTGIQIVWKKEKVGILLLAIYMPLVLYVFKSDTHISRYVHELGMAISLYAISVVRNNDQQNVSLKSILVGLVLAAFVEIEYMLDAIDIQYEIIWIIKWNEVFLFTLLASLICAFVEYKLCKLSTSNFFKSIYQSSVVFIIYLHLRNIPLEDQDFYISLFLSVTVYQIILIACSRTLEASRVSWILLASAYCLVNIDGIELFYKLSLISFLVMIFVTLAQYLRSSFILATSLFVSLYLTFTCWNKVIELYENAAYRIDLGETVFVSLLVCSVLFRASLARIVDGDKTDWWEGVISEELLTIIQNIGFFIFGALLRIPIISSLFKILRTSYFWLKYLKGENSVFNLRDIGYVTSIMVSLTILEAWIGAVSIQYPTHGGREILRSIGTGLLWGITGSIVYLYGYCHSNIFFKSVGMIVLTYPLFENIYVNIFLIGNTNSLSIDSVYLGLSIGLCSIFLSIFRQIMQVKSPARDLQIY